VFRIGYRTRQFWNVLIARPLEDEAIDRVRQVLTDKETELFLQMQPSEQKHSYMVYRKLTERGFRNKDLLTTALIHDIGKTRYPLGLVARVLIVLGRAILPQQVGEWGAEVHSDWRRIFAVAEQHPEWGAQMAAAAGSNPRVVNLIRRHQHPLNGPPAGEEDILLSYLQSADDSL
jgi:hypothetical protein